MPYIKHQMKDSYIVMVKLLCVIELLSCKTLLLKKLLFFSCNLKCQGPSIESKPGKKKLKKKPFPRQFLPSPKGIQTAGHEN